MNSIEGFKGFLSFLLLSGIIGLSYVGFKYLPASTSNVSRASDQSFEPINLKVNKLTDTSAEITWNTRADSLGILFYSDDEDCLKADLNGSTCTYKAENKNSQAHKISLEKLKPATTYFYKIKVENYSYPENATFSFSTQKKSASIETEDSDGIQSPQIDQSQGQILEGSSIKAEPDEPQEPK